ncbi:lipopolysaccharide biosynthesis protein [Halobaculum rarum]|uniref:lipopolysaccharide biosynthesis protein n=1 Tax=Halobaculum rarum TaxID=3075122 RepID=UPI0032AFBA1B
MTVVTFGARREHIDVSPRSRVRRWARLVVRLFAPGESLGERVATGGVWLSALTAADRLVRLAMLVVLARLLSPEAFGVVGLGLVAVAVLRKVLRLGLDEALIQDEQADVDAYLDTTWTLTVLRGFALWGIASLAAPAVADTVGEPQLTAVLPVLALSSVVGGFRNPGVIYFRKELAFHRQFTYSVSGTVVQAAVAVSAALAWGTAWALVAGLLAGSAARTVASHLLHPYRPRPGFDPAAARELLGYGKWIFGSGILLLLLNQGDDAIVGWLLGASALGLYGMAFRFSNAPATEVSHVIAKVTFPAFSKVQDDVEELREGFLRTVRAVAYLSFPMAVGVAAVAPVFVQAAFGPKWLPMVETMRVLALWGALRALVAVVGPLFKATDRPHYSTALQASRLVIVAALLYPATVAWGTVGTAAALVASAVIQNPIALFIALRTVDASANRLLRSLALPTAGALLMGGTVVAASRTLAPASPFIELAALVTIGVIAYLAVLAVGVRLFDVGLDRDVASLRRALTG